MGRQEINIIVTVKSLEELVFQVAPVAKAKLEKISTMKPGKMVLKSHVECEACQSDMEVNFFWCHALSVNTGNTSDDCVASVKAPNSPENEFQVHEMVKAEPLDDEEFEYEEEYLIEDLENVPEIDPEENFVMKTEDAEAVEEILVENEEESPEEIVVRVTEMVSPTPKMTKRAINDQKFGIPDNELVRKLDSRGICDFCDYRRKRLGATLSRNTFLIHCATHLIQKNGMIYSCNACGLPSETLNVARAHSLSCDQRESYRQIWKNREVPEIDVIPVIVEASDPSLKSKKYPRVKVLCHICSKYVYKQSLKDHMLKHEVGSKLPYECDACGKKFSSRDNVRKHLIVRHFPELAKYKCPKCPTVFAQKHFYDTHIMAKHKMGDVEKVTCMVCGIVVANERNLKEHNFNAHVDPLTKQKYSCKLCSKIFYDKRHLKAHMMVHLPEDEKPYKCEKCGKRFVNSYKYKQHMLEHENPDLVLRKCEICGKGYKYANSLKVHMRVHTGEQPYECKFCNRRFADRSHHRVHMKGHESELGIKLTLTAEERRLVNHGVYQPEELISQVVIE
ncbi:zinc finger protein 260-like [Culicoides brevitarsis]|uniref:zinc finger protein 260-like n=1 Tax=Culicoides brevitarsis TaxID=469753 RepID=UPI00307CA8FB